MDNCIEQECDYPEDWGCHLKEGCELEYDDFDIDYDAYQKDVMDSYVEVYKEYMPDFVERIEGVYLDSPKYYNFRTDKIFGTFVLADDALDKMKSYINEHRKDIEKVIRERHSSCDGFISFMSNDVDEWIAELEKPVEDLDERYISCLIGYIMEANCNNPEGIAWELNYVAHDKVSAFEYYRLSDTAIAEKVESMD